MTNKRLLIEMLETLETMRYWDILTLETLRYWRRWRAQGPEINSSQRLNVSKISNVLTSLISLKVLKPHVQSPSEYTSTTDH